ncbi:MAG: hypothetical protein JO369_08495 [Paucibacter sp.]|nr:hypothetical protein [Roseateles sp.]
MAETLEAPSHAVDLRGRVSLICLETRNLDLALNAIRRCTAHFRFEEIILFTDQDWSVGGMTVVRCEPIRSAKAYSKFMLGDFHRHVHTPHFLVVQWDGFVIHPERWRADFLAYDYIGAPWPHHDHAVGNGGFSLRSVRLHQAIDTLDKPECHPEDSFICLWNRPQLEAMGMRFAPYELAREFSAEADGYEARPFGFHRFGNFNEAYDEPGLLAFLRAAPDAIVRSTEGRALLKNSLLLGRRDVVRELARRRLGGALRMRIDTLSILGRYGLQRLFSRRASA